MVAVGRAHAHFLHPGAAEAHEHECICGEPIVCRSNQHRKWCSSRCRCSARKKTKPPRQCFCGKTLPSGFRRFCSEDCSKASRRVTTPPRQFTCAECGKTAETRTAGKSAAKYCSPLCHRRAAVRRQWQANSNRHFPRVQGKQRRLIFDRDGWRCGICRAVIDPALRWPHPGSASIDHIDPRGPHAPANWQAAHLACNVQAGAKGCRTIAA